ncbi:uncharacterized protein FIBRA_03791 [Fibroporia radiculosa]|uniref:Metal homeostatis protein bsd2 n=1 Tax=Fibroporia radiculosa TaxID=599839 RepID=J4GNP0_9APHY|nr:uncharacterized protein FIBRA_03791 [Fibroporia radiculosa]CCM01725.1 predicted protein [Fibroporia radiculosa]
MPAHAHYAPLPNPLSDPHADNELEAAFDDSEDEGDLDRPLQPRSTRNGYQPLAHDDYHPLLHDQSAPPSPDQAPPSVPPPGSYNFEGSDFDYARPPPGSPPCPSARALPNEFGNSNGLVPSFNPATDVDAQRSRGGWFRRTAATVLPTHYVQRLGLEEQAPSGPVGGGIHNDGVFANVVAKPSRPMRIQQGDETYLVPEESQKDAPPSYSSAQADSVPPYWETTVHAPSAAMNAGDVVVDALPTGSVFSFLWNLLVSISFQFVGFLLTYLLHTTHAAKLGSRAGLGITLIQYGFAMRRNADGLQSETTQDGWMKPYVATPLDTDEYYKNRNATTAASAPPMDENAPLVVGDGASDWISFLLMTVGWFILLTSLLGFWRVKRWERGILRAQRDNPAEGRPTGPANGALIHSFERIFGLHGLADGSLIRNGLGFSSNSHPSEDDDPLAHVLRMEEEDTVSPRGEYILPLTSDNPEDNARMAQALAIQARLHQDLRSAGLL